jgi:hypothetical protein
MTDEVVRGVAEAGFSGFCESEDCSFLGLPFNPHESLLVRAWPPNVLKLEAELFRLLESRYVVDFTEGLGLGTV